MAQIIIREQDLTTPGVVYSENNNVYIPGYAVKGPINTPTLCETLDDFKRIFGDKPYVFKTRQEYPSSFAPAAGVKGKALYEVGDYEKSWVYASELLNKGIPVLYERCYKTATSTADVKAMYPLHQYSIAPTLAATPSVIHKYANVTIQSKYPGEFYKSFAVNIDNPLTASKQTLTIKTDSGNYSYTFTLFEEVVSDSVMFYTDVQTAIDNDNVDVEITFKTLESSGSYDKTTGDKYLAFNWVKTQTGTSGVDITVDEFSVNDVSDITFVDANGDAVSDPLDDKLTYSKVTISGIYSIFASPTDNLFDNLQDRGSYDVRFITSGYYPIFEAYGASVYETLNRFIGAAGVRGDATAILDYANNPSRTLSSANDSGSVYSAIKATVKANPIVIAPAGQNRNEDGYTYASMFIPWGVYGSSGLSSIVTGNILMPPSFGYLCNYAISIQTNPAWFAIAGTARGVVGNLVALQQNVTEVIADSYQPRDDVSINAIARIRPYGFTIWGNRTLKNNESNKELVATSFLNIRQLVSSLKQQVYVSAKKLMFEQNDDILWLNFKAEITPLLDRMVGNNGLYTYQIKKVPTDKKATIVAQIILYAIEAVESFDITIQLKDQTVLVSE